MVWLWPATGGTVRGVRRDSGGPRVKQETGRGDAAADAKEGSEEGGLGEAVWSMVNRSHGNEWSDQTAASSRPKAGARSASAASPSSVRSVMSVPALELTAATWMARPRRWA